MPSWKYRHSVHFALTFLERLPVCQHLLDLSVLMGLGLPSGMDWSQAQAGGCSDSFITSCLSVHVCIGTECELVTELSKTIVELCFLFGWLVLVWGEKIHLLNGEILSGLTWGLVLSPRLLMILLLLLLLFWQQLGGSRRMLKLRTKHKIVVRRWALGSYILGSHPSSGISGCVALSKSLHLSEFSSLICHNQKRIPSYLARLS